KIHEMSFTHGDADAPLKVTGTHQQEMVAGTYEGRNGSAITFLPSSDTFKGVTEFDYGTLEHRLRELAFLNSGVRIILADKRHADVKIQELHYEGGLEEFVKYLDRSKKPLIEKPIAIRNERDGITVEVAMWWNDSYHENVLAFTNNIPQRDGGTHLAGFRGALTRQVTGYADTSGLTKKEKVTLTGDDYSEVSATALRLTEALQEMDGLANVGSDAQDVTDGITTITRVNGRRAVTISGSITDVNTQGVNRAVTQKVEEVGLGPGVILEKGGVFADIAEAFAQLGMAMVFGIILVYVVMVVSMRSFLIPFVIVLSLPLASIGALGALFITQRTLGLPALIGMLMLIGLVVTNAIVLLAFVEQLRAKGMSVYDALIEGGRTRIRPILMTAFTTSFALLPLAVIVSDGGIISAELATVVIGGLMTSTFLTLVVIPAIYSLVRRDRPVPQVAGGAVDEHMEQTPQSGGSANS
ncbi:MAG: efflux RND transporter permease subunit, partial [Chloroflexi bacterium]|nr:efflux RND transporter permease subunit [Chloroflexota bacterium]